MAAGTKTRDRLWAAIVAAVLLGAACLIVFGLRPGGFEDRIGWYLTLLPGGIPAAFIGDHLYRTFPAAERLVFWAVLLGTSFAWYFMIAYGVLKFRRLIY
jgi:hypothetical protein